MSKPIDKRIRDAWAAWMLDEGQSPQASGDEFDQWLRRVREQAWEEGVDATFYDPESSDGISWGDNPYKRPAR